MLLVVSNLCPKRAKERIQLRAASHSVPVILPGIIWSGKYGNLHCAREIGFITGVEQTDVILVAKDRLHTTYCNQGEKKKDAAAERFLQDGRGTAYPLDEEMGLQNTVLAWPQDTKAGQAIIHVAYVASSHAVLG